MLQNVNVKYCYAVMAFLTCFSAPIEVLFTLICGSHDFKKPTSQCDMSQNAKTSSLFVKGLGGGPVCFLSSLVHIKTRLLLIFLWHKGFNI